MNDGDLTIARTVHFASRNRGRRELQPGPRPITEAVPVGRVPRVSRLMALAIRFDGLIRSGAITDQADLARLGHVTRARVTQIMNLLHLAPDIQEEILFLPRITAGDDPITERDLRSISRQLEWSEQRTLWVAVRASVSWPPTIPLDIANT